MHEEAISYLRDAVAGGDSRAGFLLGIELFNTGKFDDAVRQLTAFVRTSNLPYRLVPHWLEPPVSEVVTARLVLARAASMQRRWPEAVEQAKRVLGVIPGNREAQLLLADGLFGQQQYAAAAPEYQKYLAVRPNDGHALANLGITYIVAGKLNEAIASFRQAVSAEPKNPDWRRLLGMAMADRGDYEGAAVQAREGLQLKPGDAALGELLARASAGGRSKP
jgi:tetratricopeptide (TPR) repeat protein